MQYDIKRFLYGGYNDISDYASGLHITFKSELEALDFIAELEKSYPKVALGALDFRHAEFYSVRDRIGYVFYKRANRILRTTNVNARVPPENIIPASDLLTPAFDFKEMIDFVTGD